VSDPRMPGPWSPKRKATGAGDAAVANARCEECHKDIATEWRESYHAKAYTNRAFQRALAIEPLPFCKGCHAPEADPNSPLDQRLTRLGIGCVSCHVVDGSVIAAPATRPEGGHAVSRLSGFGTVAACANCHQFAFPAEPATASALLMQSTVLEHATGPFANIACAACHMPRASDGHADHRFNITRVADLLKGAVRVAAHRVDSRTVAITLSTSGVGHAMPTGDLFRRLEISIDAVGPEQSAIASASVYLTRRFGIRRAPGGFKRRGSLGDDRLGVGEQNPREIRLTLDREAGPWPIAWRVAYQRVEHPGKVGQPDAVIDSEVEIAAGVLAPGVGLPQVDASTTSRP